MKQRVALTVWLVVMISAVMVLPSAQEPQLKARPAGTQPAAAADKRMHIDVEVTDKSGAPVTGLKAGDFTLLIDKKPVPVAEFSSVEQTVVRTSEAGGGAEKVSSEPVEVLIVLDTVNIGFTQVSYVRDQVEQYLRMNGGRLAAPTRLVYFTSAGIRMQNQATLDGNAMAGFLAKLDPTIRVLKSAAGAAGREEQFELSVKNFSLIAENETQPPGRKLLVWLGPGWPLVTNDRTSYIESDHVQNYAAIMMLLNTLRQARMTVYDVRTTSDNTVEVTDYYQEFLKPVKRVQESDPADMALGVLAVESGGRVTEPSNDVAGQIAGCVSEAQAYYTLRFEPQGGGKAGSYHSIEVKVNRPNVKVRSVTGFYE